MSFLNLRHTFESQSNLVITTPQLIESSGSAPMATLPELNFTCIIEDHFKEDLDEDVIYAIMHMDSPWKALMKSHVLKEEGNKLFRTKDYRLSLIHI